MGSPGGPREYVDQDIEVLLRLEPSDGADDDVVRRQADQTSAAWRFLRSVSSERVAVDAIQDDGKFGRLIAPVRISSDLISSRHGDHVIETREKASVAV